MMKMLPPWFGSCWFDRRIETWVLKPTVAPQLRWNVTAFIRPEGEVTDWEISFSQMKPQPASKVAAKRMQRLLFIEMVGPAGFEPATKGFTSAPMFPKGVDYLFTRA